MRATRFISAHVGVIAAIALLCGCKKETASAPAPAKPAPVSPATPDAPTAPAAPEKPEPAQPTKIIPGVISAKALADACAADIGAARAQYEFAQVELSGEIVSVTLDTMKRSVVILPANVTCFTVDPQPWKSFGVTDSVHVTGMVTFNSIDRPVIKKATVVSKGPSMLVVMDAEKLAAEHLADWKAADDRYRIDKNVGKSILIKGKVVKKTSTALYLGREDAQVMCHFDNYPDTLTKMFAPIEVGQTITLAGVWQVNLGSTKPPKWAKLNVCNLVK
jgi:hypothetical protein